MSKLLIAVPSLFLLASCEVFAREAENFRQVLADPGVQQQLIAAGKTAGEQALSGNLVGAGWTLGGVATLVVGKWLRDRVKNSAPGEIIGGKPTG